MEIQLVKVESSGDYAKVKRLYRTTFPVYERIPVSILYRNRNKDCAGFYSIYDEGNWVGLIYLLEGRDMIYIWYLAVNKSNQSKGYGGAVLEKVKHDYPDKAITLAVETLREDAPNFEQRKRRKAFYQRHGFESSGYTTNLKSMSFDLLVFGGEFHPESFKSLTREFGGKFLGDAAAYFKGKMITKN